MSVEQFMQQMAAEERGASVPAASTVWWRAEFRRRFEAERRATRPIRIAATVAYAACVIAAAALSAKFGPVVPIAVGVHAVLTVAGAALALRSGSR
jgi:fatty acid desaturase